MGASNGKLGLAIWPRREGSDSEGEGVICLYVFDVLPLEVWAFEGAVILDVSWSRMVGIIVDKQLRHRSN